MLFIYLLSIAHSSPEQLFQQGRLLDGNGLPISGTEGLTFRLYDAQSAGNLLWEEIIITQFNNGYYSVILGDNSLNPLDSALFDHSNLYWELEINTDGPLSPRTPVFATPYAFKALDATNIKGGSVEAVEIKIGSDVVIDGNGQWVGDPPSISWNSLTDRPADLLDGDDNSVLNDADVLAIVESNTININAGSTLNSDPIVTASTDADSLSELSCNSGEIVGWNGIDWVCLSDATLTEEQVVQIVTSSAITLHSDTTLNGENIITPSSDQDTLGALNCGAGQSVVFDQNNGWTCAVLAQNLSDVNCAQGETLSYDEQNGWVCSSILSSFDSDGDGAFAWEDCDDNDNTSSFKSNDADCDGIETAEDCDDLNPSSTVIADDADCDGILTADDCDDNDSSSTAIADDADCDGILTVDDCDDNNPSPLNKGSESICPASSCQDVLTSTPTASDGLYYINNNSETVQVYCDMNTDGGGWMLMSRFTQNGAMASLSTSEYNAYFKNELWIEGVSQGLPTSPQGSYTQHTIESHNWADFLTQGSNYELRQHFFKNTSDAIFDVSYAFTYNGYTVQNDAPEEDRIWTLNDRTVHTDTSGVPWDIQETPLFWLPFKDGFSGAIYTGCSGYQYEDSGCGAVSEPSRRYGNAGIIDSTGAPDQAASWGPHTNTNNPNYDLIYIHQSTEIYGQTNSNMTLLYWIR
ncbi:MAG: hypothetical protein CMK59_00275 [Proteobacteria bacterium]|nr:hypothetical protein [Pseudomonadota bacterium]